MGVSVAKHPFRPGIDGQCLACTGERGDAMHMVPENLGEARALRLTWRNNYRGGKTHREWTAPCGCAYHPEPHPHVHPCARHIEEDKAITVDLGELEDEAPA